jgi:Leucine-rich repeat (LRR) protein
MIFTKKYSDLKQAILKTISVKRLDLVYPDEDLSTIDFSQFKNLRELSIQLNVDQEHGISNSIGRLEKLEKLSFLNVNFKRFPEWLFDMKRLKYVMVRGCDMTEIPKGFSSLLFLKKLRLENMHIKSIPRDFSKMKNLEQLSLSANFKLKTIETKELPPKLKELNLAATAISEYEKDRLRQQNKFLTIY